MNILLNHNTPHNLTTLAFLLTTIGYSTRGFFTARFHFNAILFGIRTFVFSVANSSVHHHIYIFSIKYFPYKKAIQNSNPTKIFPKFNKTFILI
ncbi:hypothetical protein THERMOT_1997 [Bathymodiolus thermophilus thioautotrophic gill symbiont]|uniref:hypothetical protein n=1 Tax=Bathymodiolus thermophilus thioautotrophic gill symbiont TaxID=2360 RepID=UPI00192C93D4|nr:hypothetical protein [Bathymodiolus thermophilus thioautotrophic gill symbiont]CAB5504624.1 hypothetical protein THERMOT_1997 [Bathymodiolus thermophilus thioautotrophic gill symbiont]